MIGFQNQEQNMQFNLAQDARAAHGGKFFTVIVQALILVFTASLAWFSFIYYPQVVDRFKTVGLPKTKVISNASTFGEFPIETEIFRLVYEGGSNTYYAFIEGENIAEFADNKNSATIALKSALSVVSVCDLNVIYVSTAKLDVPQDLKNPTSCK